MTGAKRVGSILTHMEPSRKCRQTRLAVPGLSVLPDAVIDGLEEYLDMEDRCPMWATRATDPQMRYRTRTMRLLWALSEWEGNLREAEIECAMYCGNCEDDGPCNCQNWFFRPIAAKVDRIRDHLWRLSGPTRRECRAPPTPP